MPKPRVYVETTIPSFYHDPRRAPGIVKMLRWTRLWWHSAADRYELVTSAYVRNELAAGNLEIARDRLALIGEVPLIEPGPRVPLIVQAYVESKLMPGNPPVDAWHLALASQDRCDFIVSWNCKHLANPNKATHIRQINQSLALHIPRVVTPRDLLRRDE